MTTSLGTPKLMRAARKGATHLHVLPWLIAFAIKATDHGRLSVGEDPAEPEDIADQIPCVTAIQVAGALSELAAIGVLSEDPDGCARFTNWEGRQAKAGVRWQGGRSGSVDTTNGATIDSYVYYAKCDDQVKIGLSANPWSRVAELGTARPGIVLVGVERGGYDLERQRQQELGGRTDFRNNGRGSEWFPWTEAIAAHVAALNGSEEPTTKATTKKRSSAIEGEEGRKEKKKEKTTGAVAPRTRPTWVTDGVALWTTLVGTIPLEQFGQALKPIVHLHGWPAVRADLEKWARARIARGQACNPTWYAKEASARLAPKPPLVDEHGQLTEYGERMSRPGAIPA
jgi:hypothetical protein